MVRNWKLDFYRYQLQRDHVPMAAGKQLDVKGSKTIYRWWLQGNLTFTDVNFSKTIYRWWLQRELDIYRYQLQLDHLPMATATGDPIFTDIEENGAIYRWRLHLGEGKDIFVMESDKTFTDDS